MAEETTSTRWDSGLNSVTVDEIEMAKNMPDGITHSLLMEIHNTLLDIKDTLEILNREEPHHGD